MSWYNRYGDNRNNDARGGADSGAPSQDVTALIVTSDLSLEFMATVTTFNTRNGRRSSVSFLKRAGSVKGHDKWLQVGYLRQIQPSEAVERAESGLNQLCNGGSMEDEL